MGHRRRSHSVDAQRSLNRSLGRAIAAVSSVREMSERMVHSLSSGLHPLAKSCTYWLCSFTLCFRVTCRETRLQLAVLDVRSLDTHILTMAAVLWWAVIALFTFYDNFVIISDIGNRVCVGVCKILYWEIFFCLSALGFISAVMHSASLQMILNVLEFFLNVFVINNLNLFS